MAERKTMHVFYDGNCPICCKKADFLRKRDKNNRLCFIDIRAAEFCAGTIGIQMERLEKEIHSILPDGTVISGMDVVRAACREIGLGWVAAPTGWPLLRPLFDMLYRFVARNRQGLSRCFR